MEGAVLQFDVRMQLSRDTMRQLHGFTAGGNEHSLQDMHTVLSDMIQHITPLDDHSRRPIHSRLWEACEQYLPIVLQVSLTHPEERTISCVREKRRQRNVNSKKTNFPQVRESARFFIWRRHYVHKLYFKSYTKCIQITMFVNYRIIVCMTACVRSML